MWFVGLPSSHLTQNFGFNSRPAKMLGADAALAAKMLDGIATFDDVLAKMQKTARSNQSARAFWLMQTRAALALV